MAGEHNKRLLLAVKAGATTAVQSFLEKGADPNLGVGGHMPSRSMIERIELMLNHGWDINNGQMRMCGRL